MHKKIFSKRYVFPCAALAIVLNPVACGNKNELVEVADTGVISATKILPPESGEVSATPSPGATANPAPAPAPAPPNGSGDVCDDPENNVEREEVCRLVNQERAKAGVAALRLDPTITTVSQAYAVKMATEGFFSHTSPDGSTMSSRLKAGGVTYGYAGENIAMGQATPTAVMTSWMNSSGHKANILNSHYKRIGIGVYQKYWVQNFTD